MAEEWRPVTGYEGLYEVSNLGRVRSLDRADSVGRRLRGRVLKPAATHDGYLRVNLYRGDGDRYTVRVHRLVLIAFIGPAPIGAEACHGDGSRVNNRIENLRWGSPSTNNLDKVRHGTHHEARKTHCPAGHAYDAANTYVAFRTSGYKERQCRTCKRERRARDRPHSRTNTRKEELSG